ncbi:serine/threonine-protein kinase [Vibrio vulnificus]|uniref:serine/threonine-protein kinase n=1 Tax=Vibrio vulnificus TaxID=672 RepID=UPI0035651861
MEPVGNYKFDVIDNIGSGGFGYVEKIELFNMTETHSGLYARKVLDPKVDLKEYKKRFHREILSQCTCQHKHVVSIYLFNLDVEKPYFIMELADCDLQYQINNNLLDEAQKISIMFDIAKGLQHIHSHGFLHRDIKPNNILFFSSDETYKISDFGLIRKTTPSDDTEPLTSIGTVLGTNAYMAPELLYVGNDYTEKSDVFAFGKVCQAMNIQDLRIHRIIDKCCKMDPTDRYDSINVVLEALEELATEAVA